MKKDNNFENSIDDKQKLFIEVSLKEYQEIRTELREVIGRQNTVLFSSIAQFATLIGVGLAVLSTDFISDVMLWTSSIFGVLIPCITILLGVIWIDLAYRQIMMGSYIYSIETQVIQLLDLGESDTESRKVMFWEHYNRKREKVDFLSYLCSMIVYLVLPILCFFVSWYSSGWKWLNSYYITAMFFVVCFVFILLYSIYILEIYKNTTSKP